MIPPPSDAADARRTPIAGGGATAPPAGASYTLAPGAVPLPDYHLVEFLGRGGFGEVWKAIGPGGFVVALKFIRLGGHAAKAEERAAELLRSKDIRHPNLLGLSGAWRRDDVLIFAMELADRTLAQRLGEAVAQGLPGVPFAELVEYLRDAAKGLDHLHTIGVQHRDVKPQNLLLVGGGVKVADFGLAKLLDHTSASNTGAMTPGYAAPEFLQGRVSAHSDQYALAVSYCQLRGGRLPFAGTAAQVMLGHLHETPDLTMLPDAEHAAVARALAKEPHDRWPSCGAFVDALEAAAPTDPDPSATSPFREATRSERTWPLAAPRRSRRPWAALTLAGVLLLLLAAALAITIIYMNRPPPAATVPVAIPDEPPTPPDKPPEPPPPIKDPVKVEQPHPYSLGLRLTTIPAGKFLMGSPKEETGRYANEGPQHEATIAQPFDMAVHPVTRSQFAAFVQDAAYQTEAETDGQGGFGYDAATRTLLGPDPKYTWKDAGFPQTDDDPVVNVSWNDAVKFCEWLSKKEQKTYELPTEAEWEYACRAGTTTRFWSGDDDASLNGAENIRDASLKGKLDPERYGDWAFPTWDDGYPFTSPVGKYKANPWGLFDLSGNVQQWCADRYAKYGEGPQGGDFRVARGGSWRGGPALVRSAGRHVFEASARGADLGFRVVLRADRR